MAEPQTYLPSASLLKTMGLPSEHELRLEKKAVRMLDCTILPMVTMFHLLAFLDRANIGNARVAGLQKDLHMTDNQYQICVTVLFGPYILAELPSNLLLRKIHPRFVLPTLVTLWGIVVVFQGFVSSYPGLIIVRTVLGLLEGPMTPGIVLYLSGFYTRRELSLRIGIFYSSASLAGAFSGLLAAAIEKMDGIGGRPGWSWIFILEGLLSVLVGFIGFFIIPSTPHGSKFLTDNQKDIIMMRLEMDRPSIKPVDTFSLKEVLRSITSPQVVIVFIMLFMGGTMLSGFAVFLPSIVNQLGFSPNKTQLLSVGPFAVGFFVTLTSTYLSDRYESRGIATALVSLLSVAGFSLYLGSEQKFTLYGALYLLVPGVYAITPILTAWMANNSEAHYRRATSIALGFMASNSGGILSTWRYPTKEGPRFTKTTIMNLTFSILVIMGSLINMAYLSWRNKVKTGERAKLLEKCDSAAHDKASEDGGLSTWMELGDDHPDFLYTL